MWQYYAIEGGAQLCGIATGWKPFRANRDFESTTSAFCD